MADLKQCETMIQGGSFMTLGPRPWHRCTNAPHWIGTDTASGDTQSLCDSCAEVAVKKLAPDSYELDWIVARIPAGDGGTQPKDAGGGDA